IATAWPLILLGKISAIKTQQTGPQDIINEAVYKIIKNNVDIPMILKKAREAIPNIPIAIPIEPRIKSGFLPHISTVKIATTVKTTLTAPIITVCNIDASFVKPMLSNRNYGGG